MESRVSLKVKGAFSIPYISSTDILSKPTESAFCLPSATTVTTELAGRLGVMMAPFEVSPGHMMLAPERTNVMAPLSTCISGQMNGSGKQKRHESEKIETVLRLMSVYLHLCTSLSEGMYGPSRCLKKR